MSGDEIMQEHYPFVVDYTQEGQPIWSKWCPKCNSYTDYSQTNDMKYVTDCCLVILDEDEEDEYV